MNQSYRRQTNLYQPHSPTPFRLSRSKIDLFLQCPRCFYFDRRLGISLPSWPAFTLNAAVDALLKKEFDLLRQQGKAHDLMKQYRLNALPFNHPQINTWRNNFVGQQYHHQETNLIIFGAIDDLWQTPTGELLIVDYKATSTAQEITLEDKYKQSFKKQVEVYQWLFRRNGFKVSHTAYFVYANAGRNRPSFDGRLEFQLMILPYQGDTAWLEPTLLEIKKVLDADLPPPPSPDCEYCRFCQSVSSRP